MADTPVDDGLGRDSSRPSFRSPEWLVQRIEEFQTDYNNILNGAVANDEEYAQLELTSQSDALRRIIDIGLGAFYAGDIRMFAAPPGEAFCVDCGASGGNIRVGIVPQGVGMDDPYEIESRLCLACGRETVVRDADDEEESDEDSPFDGVEA